MTFLVLAAAASASLLHHYVFSFQRFTLAVSRNNAAGAEDVPEVQLLMTPAFMGALGWLSTLFVLGSAVWIGLTFAWWWGLAFFLVDMFVVGGILPLLPARRHFAALATSELARHELGPNAPLAAALLSDVRTLREGAPLR